MCAIHAKKKKNKKKFPCENPVSKTSSLSTGSASDNNISLQALQSNFRVEARTRSGAKKPNEQNDVLDESTSSTCLNKLLKIADVLGIATIKKQAKFFQKKPSELAESSFFFN